jgi:YHS domain-containing protein
LEEEAERDGHAPTTPSRRLEASLAHSMHPIFEHYKREKNTMTKDPICKMDVDETKTNFYSDHEGLRYHFCSEECKDTFDSQPERYAIAAA